MKVGFILHDVSFGGGERVLNTLMDFMYRAGHEIFVFTWNEKWTKTNLPYKIILVQHYPNKFSKIRAYRSFLRNLKEHNPDCLITFSSSLAEVCIWAARKLHIPFIMSERVDPLFLPTSRFHRFFERLLYTLSDGLVFQTAKVQSFFSSRIARKSIVIPNPILDDHLPLITDLSLIKPEIVSAGRLSDQKNFKLLIDAYAGLKTDYKLKIYGDGPLKSELSDQIQSLGLENKVFLMGKVKRVVDEIQSSDIFVLPSLHEGMPNALMEAMAMGLSCICTDVPSYGARELIENGFNGLIVPVNDKIQLEKAMKELLENDELRHKLKLNAVKIRETNSKNIIIPMWIEYINNVIARKNINY